MIKETDELLEEAIAELTDGHLALDRQGVPREDHGIELAIVERINELAKRVR